MPVPHVLHVIESLEFGGAEKVVVHLANKLSNDYRVSLCLTKRQGELLDDVSPGIEVHFLDTGEGNNLRLPGMLARLIRRENVTIVHSHEWGVYLEAALAVRRCPGVRLFHTVHGHYTQYAPGFRSRLKISLRHFLERRASAATDRIIPVSDAIRDYIVGDIGIAPDKVLTIHNGIAGLNPAGPDGHTNKTPVPGDVLRLVTVGRLASIKNYPLLLRAFQIASAGGANLRLQFIGDGPERASLEELCQSLDIANGRVEFLGFREDIPALLRNNDVFVLSSDYEGISIAMLEAMSLAMPVIATRVGGVPETVVEGVTGFLVEKDDANAFADAILKLSGGTTRSTALIQRLGHAAQQHFNENFHEDVVLRQYRKLYDD